MALVSRDARQCAVRGQSSKANATLDGPSRSWTARRSHATSLGLKLLLAPAGGWAALSGEALSRPDAVPLDSRFTVAYGVATRATAFVCSRQNKEMSRVCSGCYNLSRTSIRRHEPDACTKSWLVANGIRIG